jgi:hypothetical protein
VLFISRHGTGGIASRAAHVLQTNGLPLETYDGVELERRYPQHRNCAELVGTLDPSGGFVRADETVSTVSPAHHHRRLIRDVVGDEDGALRRPQRRLAFGCIRWLLLHACNQHLLN